MPSSHSELHRQSTSDSSTVMREFLLWSVGFRFPMPVTEVMVFDTVHGKTGYYVCPRCNITMEREYASFCDRCGQRLNWKDCRNAKIVYPEKR